MVGADQHASTQPEQHNIGYSLAAAGREVAEDARLALLEQIFDPLSRRRRDMVQPGWRCLEVGAGRGSMAVWLAQRVGPSGHVVATDVDVGYLEQLCRATGHADLATHAQITRVYGTPGTTLSIFANATGASGSSSVDVLVYGSVD